jgi:tetratricopeptide (TPR) repeat protein/O-antigen ligase
LGRPADPEETAVARFADGVLEAGWLLALLVVPTFFDIYSTHPFEPDKAMVVRVLGLVMAAAGLVRALEAWGRWRRPRAMPLAAPVALYVGAAALSTALSLAPRLSLWGSDARGEGLATLAAYVVVFAAVAARLRRPAQLDRVIDVIVAGSVPVTLYGLQQAAGLDLLDWERTYQEWRVSTTLGNPIFAGAYLILTLPVTLAAMLEWRRRPADPGGPWWRRLRLALYASAGVLQLSVLVLTGSRGPWLGAGAGLVAFGLLGAAIGRRRRVAAAALALGLGAVAFVALLNAPRGPLQGLRETRLLGRLGHILDAQGARNPGDLARVRVWEGALALARPRPPLPLAEGEDRRGGLRPLVGYGPETLQVAFGAIYDAEFARLERRNPDLADTGVSTFETRVPDRSHNELLDSLVTGGLLGALAHLVLHGGLQVFGLRALGLLGSRRDRMRLAALAVGGGVIGAVAAGRALSWGFVAVGLPLGLVAGWTAYVVGCAFRPRETGAPSPWPLEVALVAALLGHFVDIHFGPLVVTGRLYFWALAGLLVAAVLIRQRGERDEGPALHEGPEPQPSGRWRRLLAGVPAGLLAAALAITLVYDFVDVAAKGATAVSGAWRVVAAGSGPQRWALAAGVAAVLALLVLEAGRDYGPRWRILMGALVIATAATLGFAVLHVGALRRTVEARNVADLAWSLGGVFARYAASLVALALLLGAVLTRPGPKSKRATVIRGALAAAAIFALALLGARPALATVAARVMQHFAMALQAQSFVADGLALFDRAAETAPWEAPVFRAQGEAYLTASRRTGSPLRRQEYLRRAETALARARVLDPLTPDNHANLARVARWRAELSRAPEVARGETDDAGRHYAAAARLVPANTLLLNEWAQLDLSRQDFAAAEEKLQRSLRLDPTFDYTYAALGDLYMARGKAGADDPTQEYRRAADAYAQAYGRRPSLKAILSLGLAYERLGEKQQAVDTYLRALAMRPPYSTSWAVHEQLAGLYLALGNRAEAERQAQQAWFEVPDRDRPGLGERLRAAKLLPGA